MIILAYIILSSESENKGFNQSNQAFKSLSTSGRYPRYCSFVTEVMVCITTALSAPFLTVSFFLLT